jgi:hypothetical protein
MLRLGDLANKEGDFLKAVELWKEAQPLFERSSQAKDVAQIDTRLAMVEDAPQRSLAYLTTLHAPIELFQLSISDDIYKIKEVEDTVDADKAGIPVAV